MCLSYWTFTSFYSLGTTATVCFYACLFTRFLHCNSCFCLSVCHYYCIWAKLPDSNKCMYVYSDFDLEEPALTHSFLSLSFPSLLRFFPSFSVPSILPVFPSLKHPQWRQRVNNIGRNIPLSSSRRCSGSSIVKCFMYY